MLLKQPRHGGLLHRDLTREIISRAFVVYNKLGGGFLENVYIGAMEIELAKSGLRVVREAPIAVEYDGIVVGTYRMDLLVEAKVVLEAKTGSSITEQHERQLLNYLRSSRVEVGLLFLFGVKPDFRRFIHTNDRKPKCCDPWPVPCDQ